MIKYIMAATVLKIFSSHPIMKKLYRIIGNVLGSRIRLKKGLPKVYICNAKLFLHLIKKFNTIHNGNKLLELGTGWVHWWSIIIRLFYDVSITMFDIWDNRQLEPLKLYCLELADVFNKHLDLDPSQYNRINKLLREISYLNSFDELYQLLGLNYIVEPSGTLHHFQNELFNTIFSYAVLEHIKKEIVTEYIRDIFRLLKPGGYSIHIIGIHDHLSDFDSGVSKKNYLKYSDKSWTQYFENEVQYFNRIQKSEWVKLFHNTGFELVYEESVFTEIVPNIVNRKYRNLSKQDLECVSLRIIHRKLIRP